MTTSKRLFALLLSALLCLSLAACQSGGATASPSPSPSASASADPSSAPSSDIEVDLTQSLYAFASGLPNDGTAVTVNGSPISNQMFFYWLAYDCTYLSSAYSSYGISADFTDESIVSYLLNDAQTAVTYYSVLHQLCEENQVTLTDEQSAALQADIDDYVAENGEGSLELLLQRYGLTEEQFRYVLTNSLLFTNLADKLVGQPSQADLEQYVTDNGIFSVKHILLQTTTEDTTDSDGKVTQTADEHNAAQKALAEDLLAQLQASDDMTALFDTLMNEHSEDGRGTDGSLSSPDGYTFDSSSSLVDGFREASLALEVGQLSDLVETDYGYHILLRLPVTASDYSDDWITDSTDALITAGVQAAEVSVEDSILSLDLNSFYNRYVAYLAQLDDQAG